MRRALVTVTFLFAALLAPTGVSAGAPVVVSGGGTGTFDGVHPGSQFGFGVTRSADDMRDMFRKEVKPRLTAWPAVGKYNQEV